jgi:hypothetical protein
VLDRVADEPPRHVPGKSGIGRREDDDLQRATRRPKTIGAASASTAKT